jgi:glycosyltransferase involved in cell wall biosynthesis
MRILILTQKVDERDPILGFFHRWIEEFAKHCENVIVICLEKGMYDLPKNVRVLSLGKETDISRAGYIARFYRHIWRERNDYDAVFVHMTPEYAVLGGLLWRIWRKKIMLWYTHRSVDAKLRWAAWVSNVILTASDKSFRLRSKKVRVMGHGIDTELFSPAHVLKTDTPRIVTWGRVSPTKNIHAIIEAYALTHRRHPDWLLVIIGPADEKGKGAYAGMLKKLVSDKGLKNGVQFLGALPPERIPGIIASKDVLVNLSDTGSLDKSVLEAMAAGIWVLTSNEAFGPILPEACITRNDPAEIASKIEALAGRAADPALRRHVEKEHSLPALIARITALAEPNHAS